mmetsp:Transcript_10691/g.18887  ORF Transcript_10691/g.18887 Transcript_10691/m.18887 type:complete len:788 (+) Transcript_10691:358-2721(+)
MQQNAEVALTALEHWKQRKYDQCLDCLKGIDKNLDELAVSDSKVKPRLAKAKVEHNIALSEFALNGMQMSEQLFQRLGKVATRVEDEIKAASSTNGNEGTTTSSGSTEGANLEDKGDAKDGTWEGGATGKARFQPDASFALYNQAVILVHLRKWRSSLTILEDLFRYIDALDESLALSICFLLLDVYTLVARGSGYGDGGLLLGHIVEKAQSVVDYLEKPHIFNGHMDWSGTAPANSHEGSSANSGTGNVAASNDEEHQQVFQRYIDGIVKVYSVPRMKVIRKRLSIYKYKLVLLQASISSIKTDLKASSSAVLKQLEESEMATVTGNSTEPSADAPGNDNNNNDEPSVLKLDGPEGMAPDSFDGILECLKANMEYLSGSYDASYKLLQRSAELGIEPGLFWNNVGCIHHMLGQHRCAAMYFTWAFKFYNKRGVQPVGDKFSSEVAFNLGSQLLHSGLPQRAYECFLVAAHSSYHLPRLWLHVAECAVMAHGQEEEDAYKTIVECVTGQGMHRKMLLAKEHDEGKKSKNQALKSPMNGSKGGSKNSEDSMLDPYLGLSATNKVLFLLNKAENDAVLGNNTQSSSIANFSKTNEKGNSTQMASKTSPLEIRKDKGSSGMLESDTDQNRQEAKSMRLSALLCRSYLAAAVKNWSLVTTSARDALSLLETMPLHSDAANAAALAHSYLAEALLHLPLDQNGKAQALEHMSKALEAEAQETGLTNAQTRSLMKVNAALVRLVNGELEEAGRLLHLMPGEASRSPHAVRALAFLYLERGEPDRARHLLKTGR